MFRFLQNLFNYGPTPEESLVGFFPDMDAATEWARGVLAETGTDPEAEFGLAAAAHLVKQLL